MPGQYNTIRDEATGKLRKTTPEEVERFKFSDITPPPPAAKPGALTQADVDFVQANNQEAEPPPLPSAAPPPLPPKAPPVQPPPLPPAAPDTQEEDTGAGAAASGASVGRVLGPAGMVAGAAVGYAASQSLTKSPIGSLEGRGQMGGGDQDTLKQLLFVQQQAFRIGTPIKGAVATNPANSRM